eukprot:sb/3465903/
MLSFGSYFCFDNPAALAQEFKNDLGLEVSDVIFGESRSIEQLQWETSKPSTHHPFYNPHYTLFTVGQLVFALGAYIDSKAVMYAGRFIFGLGGENLAVAANTYVVSWFAGKEINMVFGINLSASRMGSTVGMVSLSPIYKALSTKFQGTHLMGVVLTIGETVKLSDITRFSGATWLIFAICVTYYVAIFPFISLGKLFFEQKFGLSQAEAGVCNSLVYFVGAVASPVAGAIIDKTGKNVLWLLLAVLITLLAFALLTFTFLHPYFAMVLIAIAYSICASALWPMVSLVVPEYQLGTAYGMMQSIQNLGLAVVSLLAGALLTKSESPGFFCLPTPGPVFEERGGRCSQQLATSLRLVKTWTKSDEK